MFTITMDAKERDALLLIVGTLERKAAKGEFWKGRMLPLLGLFARVREAKPADTGNVYSSAQLEGELPGAGQ